MGGEGFPRLDLFFIGLPVNVNKALNEIPVLSRTSMSTSQQLWAEQGAGRPGTELILLTFNHPGKPGRQDSTPTPSE